MPSALEVTIPKCVKVTKCEYTIVGEEGTRLPDTLKSKIDLFPAFQQLLFIEGASAVELNDRIQLQLPFEPNQSGDILLNVWGGLWTRVKNCHLERRMERIKVKARATRASVIIEENKTDGEIASEILLQYVMPQISKQVKGDGEIFAQLAGLKPIIEVVQYADLLGWEVLPPIGNPIVFEAYLGNLDSALPTIAMGKSDSAEYQQKWVRAERSIVCGLRERQFGQGEATNGEPTATPIEETPRTNLLDGGEWGVDTKRVPVRLRLRQTDAHIMFEAPTRSGKTHAVMALVDEVIQDEKLPVVVVGQDRRWPRRISSYDSAVFYDEVDMEVVMNKQFTYVHVDDFKEIDQRVILPMHKWLTSLPESATKKLIVVFEEASRCDTEGLMRFFSESLKYGAIGILVVQRSERMIRRTTRGQCGMEFVGRLTRAYFDEFAKVYGQDFARELMGVGKRMKKYDFMAFGLEIETPFVFRVTRPFSLGPELTDVELRRLAWSASPPTQKASPPSQADTPENLDAYRKVIREHFRGQVPSVRALVAKARELKAQGLEVDSSWPYVQRALDKLKDAGELVNGPKGGPRYVLKEVAHAAH